MVEVVPRASFDKRRLIIIPKEEILYFDVLSIFFIYLIIILSVLDTFHSPNLSLCTYKVSFTPYFINKGKKVKLLKKTYL